MTSNWNGDKRYCPRCDTWKKHEGFQPSSHSWCRQCVNAKPKAKTKERVIRTRARHRARGELVRRYPGEYEALVEMFTDLGWAEASELEAELPEKPNIHSDVHQVLTADADIHSDVHQLLTTEEPTPLLRSGPRAAGETAVDRLAPPKDECGACSSAHARKHRCPICNTAPQARTWR